MPRWKRAREEAVAKFKNPKRVAAGRKSKRKGNKAERDIAKLFQEWWGVGTFVRTPSSGGWATVAARETFRTCGDIITDQKDFPFTIENKAQEGWTLDQIFYNENALVIQWWKQTLSETPEGMHPLLVIKRNRFKPLVIFQNNLIFDFECKNPQITLHTMDHGLLFCMTLSDFFLTKPERWKVLDAV